MKFGGTSMKDLKAIRSAASHVHEAVKLGKKSCSGGICASR